MIYDQLSFEKPIKLRIATERIKETLQNLPLNLQVSEKFSI